MNCIFTKGVNLKNGEPAETPVRAGMRGVLFGKD
jgi:hypothetical protein